MFFLLMIKQLLNISLPFKYIYIFSYLLKTFETKVEEVLSIERLVITVLTLDYVEMYAFRHKI